MTPSCLKGCHDIERHDPTETARPLRFAEQEASISDSVHPYGSSSRPLSKPLHNRAGTEDLYASRARSEAMLSHIGAPHSQSPRCFRAPPQDQLSQEDHLHTCRSAPEEDELLRPPLGTNTFDENKRQQEEEDDDDDDDDSQPPQEVNNVAAALVRIMSLRKH